jgi:threonine aldolase
MAAACLYSLESNVQRLAEDHENARRLAEGLAELPEITLDPSEVESNIVLFSVPDAAAFVSALEEHGVWLGAMDATRVRAVTHLDVDQQGIDSALTAIRKVL